MAFGPDRSAYTAGVNDSLSVVSWMVIVGILLVLVGVLLVVIARSRSTVPPAVRDSEVRTIPLPLPVIEQIDELIAQNKKIAAIKVVRENTGLGLSSAKERIDRWDSANERLNTGQARPPGQV